MDRIASFTLVAVLPLCVIANGSAEDSMPISVTQFGRANVIGYLGHPLGTVVRVTGVCVDGNVTHARIDANKILLEVRAVNGTVLKRPVRFDHPYVRDRSSLPKPDTRFDYFVHEHGAFSGLVEIPANVDSSQRVAANDGFYYHPALTIHSKNGHDRPLEPANPTQRVLDKIQKMGMPPISDSPTDG
ncbi:hypothetical protein [Planctomycetes bacterium TBK1r]